MGCVAGDRTGHDKDRLTGEETTFEEGSGWIDRDGEEV